MLNKFYTSREHYYIPRLVPIGTAEFSSGHTFKSFNRFKLDWDHIDKFKADQYQSWRTKHWPEQLKHIGDKCPQALPGKYHDIVRSLTFALSGSYHREIKHFAQLYLLERLRERKFDTVIRDMCLETAAAAINCAFKLLADCLYDEKTKGWLREDVKGDNVYTKSLARHLLMYEFWSGSVGRGLVWDHAEMPKLLCQFEDQALYGQALREIEEWHRDQERFFSYFAVPSPEPKKR